MRKTVWLGVIWIISAAAINACGTSGGTAAASEAAGDQGAGGGVTTTSSSGTGAATSSSSSSTASSSSGAAMVNGCDPATAVDHLASANVMVAFGGAEGLKYNPACIKIAKGASVTFAGDFTAHPLAGGDAGTPDATSPITATGTGSMASFTFPNAGSFPYYCTVHVGSSMQGAVFVQ